MTTLPPLSLDEESKPQALWWNGAEINVCENRKLKTKAKQMFKDFCISGVKKVVRLVRDY